MKTYTFSGLKIQTVFSIIKRCMETFSFQHQKVFENRVFDTKRYLKVDLLFSHMVSILEVPDEQLTPGMRQYKDAKLENPDCVILLRMGDFYEMFYEDAVICARDLEITLTSRGKGEKCAPLAGIPYHALDPYLGKLVKKGHKVAIIEQLEDPKLAKGLVKRGCVRIVTPGTLIESTLLEASENNYITSFVRNATGFHFCFADLSTGELLLGETTNSAELLSELMRRGSSEVLLPESLLVDVELVQQIRDARIFVSSLDDFYFRKNQAMETLTKQFGEKYISEIDVDEKSYSLLAAGAMLQYLQNTQKKELKHFTTISRLSNSSIMHLDRQTLANLELVVNSQGEKGKGSLLQVLDKTVSSAGSRLLKRMIKEPLLLQNEIELRLGAVEELVSDPLLREQLQELLALVYDLKRLIGRVSYGNASPKDLIALRNSFVTLPKIVKTLKCANSDLLQELSDINIFENLASELSAALKDEPNTHIREGGVIAFGYSNELDELITLSKNSKQFLHQLLEKEKAATGITTLRISYNRVFGYFLEVSKKNIVNVPTYYMRKQTTANSERYITEELKVLEDKILNAQEKMISLEYALYTQLMAKCAQQTVEIQKVAEKLASLDVFCSLATVACLHNYVRPRFVDVSEDVLEIIDGRHPVVEQLQNDFIPNSVKMNSGEMMIITGPNTSGKSTVMRQTALIVLMAQIGSFVPARSVKMSICDRIFTRVGAQDDLSAGQSTFMVEMLETATILKYATSSSLILLDEIGRGTSTFDGVAIAWSCAEYIYNKIRAKTMFATHYHILNKLADQFEKVHNYNVAVREVGNEIIFLRILVAGGTDQSHGIHVARMAGVPRDVVVRAQEIQAKLEKEDDMMAKVKGKIVREQLDLSGF